MTAGQRRGPADLSGRGVSAKSLKSLFAPVLTSHTGKDETSAETGHNAGTNISLR